MSINVNKQIEEAMERGEFTNLPGRRQAAQAGYESLPHTTGTDGEPTSERERICAAVG